MQFSLGLLKPDCIERGLVDEVLDFIERSGLSVIMRREVRLDLAAIAVLYASSAGRDYYEPMCAFLMSGPSVAYLVKGADNAVAHLNELVGPKDPADAEPSTVRGRFGESIRRNISHSTLDDQTFWEEAQVFFTEAELVSLGIVR